MKAITEYEESKKVILSLKYRSWLREMIRQYPTNRACAKAIGIPEQRVCELMAGKKFGVEILVKYGKALQRATGQN